VVLHAPSSRRRKGTEHVIAACEGLDVELDIVEGLPHDEAQRHYERADIVVDQLNAGWYGIFALEAMALGKPVLSYLRDEAVQETEGALDVQVPIVQVTKETLRDRIAELAASAEERRRIGASSRAYVEQVHDADKGADRLIAIYDAL
jgi:glycosyltransferase involved in cell wall biosynthesis